MSIPIVRVVDQVLGWQVDFTGLEQILKAGLLPVRIRNPAKYLSEFNGLR